MRHVKTATIHSRCECQAALVAELDEHKYVLRGWAVDRTRKQERLAPAQSIGAQRDRFDVSWFCPFCIRNTLRSFSTSGLAWRERPASPPGPPKTGPSSASPATG
jgi:hypothetical protein